MNVEIPITKKFRNGVTLMIKRGELHLNVPDTITAVIPANCDRMLDIADEIQDGKGSIYNIDELERNTIPVTLLKCLCVEGKNTEPMDIVVWLRAYAYLADEP
jgi:hypothetical protein